MKKDAELAAEIGLAFEDEIPKKHRNLKAPWKPGQSGNPLGRPKGARSVLSEEFLQALQDSFKEGGLDAIKKVRDKRPQDYLKVLASILPKQVDVTIDPIEQLSEKDLERHLSGLLDAIADRIAEDGRTSRASVAAQELEKQARKVRSLH